MESSNAKAVRLGFVGAFSDVGKLVKGLDIFGAPLPQFNLRGEGEVKTLIGGIVSFVIMIVTFLFAAVKMQQLLEYKNPSIAIFNQEIEASVDNSYKVNEGFMIAFGLDTYGRGMKNDERYVKWIARHQKATTGSPEDRDIKYFPVRYCTDADFDKFYEPSKSSEQRIKKFRKNGGLYCIDF